MAVDHSQAPLINQLIRAACMVALVVALGWCNGGFSELDGLLADRRGETGTEGRPVARELPPGFITLRQALDRGRAVLNPIRAQHPAVAHRLDAAERYCLQVGQTTGGVAYLRCLAREVNLIAGDLLPAPPDEGITGMVGHP